MKINDIDYLQAELDTQYHGLFVVYPSVGTSGLDLHNAAGYVATYDDCDKVRHEVLES